ncbi:MAG TPA: hypothetical protein VF519_04835 [Mycobacteriales bacterium]
MSAFDLASIRRRVLDAWAASPARFREDANAESDAAASPALVAELAQNAYDAAARAGVPGRLLLEVRDGTLYAANTGAPLDAAGVEALCHLRASAKTGGVGRYGIGFKAVLAYTSEPAVHSRTGSVLWSRARTLAEVRALPSLADELARRGDAVPVMRLPYDAAPDPHAAALLETYDTVVVLPLDAPVPLDGVDETLLLTLPLESVTVAGRVVTLDPGWRVHRLAGELPAALLADRPVEERERTAYAITVATPPPGVAWTDRRLRAPQPADEVVDVPVFVSVPVPLEPSRRHVVPGPLTAWLVERAAEAYVALLESLPPSPDLLDLLPSTLPAGPVDLALREALAPLLPGARVFPGGRRGEESAVLDLGPASAPVTALLDLPQLLPAEWLRRRAALRSLGVRVLDTADVVELLAGLGERPPSWWASLYEALAAAPDREALRALPVPLADGRVVPGPRGLLIGDASLAAATREAGVPLRWVHPEAATGGAAAVLRAAGAEDAEPGALLDALRDAVEESLDDDPPVPPDALAGVVLRILRDAPGAAGGREWLGSLALPDADGDLRAADELLLPAAHGGRLVRWVREDSPFGVVADSVVDEHGADALVAAGVLATFAVVRDDGGAGGHDLDLEDEYDAPPGPFEAVRDLEWVRDDAWPEALAELPVLDGYTIWWLRRHPVVRCADGTFRRPGEVAAPDADPYLAGLYATAVPHALNDRLGLVTTVDALDDDGLADLADRVAAAADLAATRVLYAALARAAAARDVLLDPPHVRAVRDGALVTVPTGEAYAVDRPDLLPLLAGVPWLPVDTALAATVADVLGCRLASEIPVSVTTYPTSTARLADLVAGAPDEGVDVDPELTVNGVRLTWFAGGRAATVDGSPHGLARLAAYRQGRWGSRHAIEAALRGDRDDESLLDPLT